MELFSQDEFVITEAFKEMNPWKGDKLSKWQNYLTNLCMVNRMSVIPTLSFADGSIQSLITPAHHSMNPPRIYLKCFSVQDLLFHFYNFKSEWTKNEVDKNKAIEYSVGLFYSVWPNKIEQVVLCPENKFIRSIAIGLNEALNRNPRYKKHSAKLCEEHSAKISKPVHYPGQFHPELN